MAVYHRRQGERIYKMCRACGTHNVSNRGAIELVPVEQEKR
jgi:hypothetical protein